MENLWMKPEVVEVNVNSECTAYSGMDESEIF